MVCTVHKSVEPEGCRFRCHMEMWDSRCLLAVAGMLETECLVQGRASRQTVWASIRKGATEQPHVYDSHTLGVRAALSNPSLIDPDHTCYCRYLLGVSDEERQARREQILATSAKDFKVFADAIEAVRGPAGRVVAVTSAERAEKVNEATPGFWDIKKVM